MSAKLVRGGVKIKVLSRSFDGPKRRLNYTGLRGVQEEFWIENDRIDNEESEISNLLVTTKSYQVTKALKGVLARISNSCKICVLCNGLGVKEEIEEEMGDQLDIKNMMFGATSCGSEKVGDEGVVERGEGETFIGRWEEVELSIDDSFQQLLSPLNPTFIQNHQELRARLMVKLCVNGVINPITALTRQTNSIFLDNEEIRTLAQSTITSEIHPILSKESPLIPTPSQLMATVMDVAQKTRANQSSMLCDVLEGRKSENDFILGYLIRKGAEHSISTPTLQTLHTLIQAHDNSITT